MWQDGKEERRDKDGKKDKEGNKEKVERPRRRLQRQNSIDLGLQPPPSVLQPPPSVLTGNSSSSSLSLSIILLTIYCNHRVALYISIIYT